MNDDQAAGGLAAESLGPPLRDRPAAIKGISVVGVVQAWSRGLWACPERSPGRDQGNQRRRRRRGSGAVQGGLCWSRDGGSGVIRGRGLGP